MRFVPLGQRQLCTSPHGGLSQLAAATLVSAFLQPESNNAWTQASPNPDKVICLLFRLGPTGTVLPYVANNRCSFVSLLLSAGLVTLSAGLPPAIPASFWSVPPSGARSSRQVTQSHHKGTSNPSTAPCCSSGEVLNPLINLQGPQGPSLPPFFPQQPDLLSVSLSLSDFLSVPHLLFSK